MKIVRIPLVVLTLAMLLGGQPPQAKGWSLANLNPFAKKKTETARHQVNAPSPWQRIDAGAKKFAAKTKKALTPKKQKNNPSLWSRQQASTKKKNSFWSSWFKPKPAEAPKTMKDWWKLKRPAQ